MILKEDFVVIHELNKKGHSIREISRLMKLNRRTVKKSLMQESYKRSIRQYTGTSKLEPYKEYIKTFVNKSNHRIPYSVILEDIQNMGYVGSRSILQDYLTLLYKDKNIDKDPVVRFETEPGKQMQVDWTTIRSGKNPIHAFVAVLGYARQTFVYFVNNMEEENLITCHEKAFIFFTGTTKTILYDNMKAVVIERDAYGKGHHKYNGRLLDLSKACGFEIKLCRPYRAKTKGKVERFNSYLKGNFYRPLCIKLQDTNLEVTCEILNSRISSWLKKANNRVHGTTKEKPSERFKIEQPLLIPYGLSNCQESRDTRVGLILPTKHLENTKRMIQLPETFVQKSNLAEYDQLLGARS